MKKAIVTLGLCAILALPVQSHAQQGTMVTLLSQLVALLQQQVAVLTEERNELLAELEELRSEEDVEEEEDEEEEVELPSGKYITVTEIVDEDEVHSVYEPITLFRFEYTAGSFPIDTEKSTFRVRINSHPYPYKLESCDPIIQEGEKDVCKVDIEFDGRLNVGTNSFMVAEAVVASSGGDKRTEDIVIEGVFTAFQYVYWNNLPCTHPECGRAWLIYHWPHTRGTACIGSPCDWWYGLHLSHSPPLY